MARPKGWIQLLVIRAQHAPGYVAVHNAMQQLAERGEVPISPNGVYYTMTEIDPLAIDADADDILRGAPDADEAEIKHKIKARIQERLNRLRRAVKVDFGEHGGICNGIPMSWVHDTKMSYFDPPNQYDEPADVFTAVLDDLLPKARSIRQAGQARRVFVYCEARGMQHWVRQVAHHYGCPVLSGGGQPGVKLNHRLAEEIGELLDIDDYCTHAVVLWIGDLDPHGLIIADSVAEDTLAFLEDRSIQVEFRRVAVTANQVEEYGLEQNLEKPAARGAQRGVHGIPAEMGAVEAEALGKQRLTDILSSEIEDLLDTDNFSLQLESEPLLRSEAAKQILRGLARALTAGTAANRDQLIDLVDAGIALADENEFDFAWLRNNEHDDG